MLDHEVAGRQRAKIESYRVVGSSKAVTLSSENASAVIGHATVLSLYARSGPFPAWPVIRAIPSYVWTRRTTWRPPGPAGLESTPWLTDSVSEHYDGREDPLPAWFADDQAD